MEEDRATKRARIIAGQAARDAAKKLAAGTPPPPKPRTNWAASAPGRSMPRRGRPPGGGGPGGGHGGGGHGGSGGAPRP